MRSLARVSAIAGLFALTLTLGACVSSRPGPGGVSASWTEDQAQIRAMTQEAEDAWNRADLPGHLAAMYADTTTFMTPAGPQRGVAFIEDAFDQAFWVDGRPRQQLRFEEVVVRRLGGDAALETGRFVLHGGGLPEQSGRFTLVWVRTPDGWRAVHDHSS